MSVMTKFLKQTCKFERAIRDNNGLVALNEHGDIQYEYATELTCRREQYVKDMLTSNGSILKTSSRYFLDDQIVVRADDRLDGHVILSCEEYIDQLGACVGYEAYV